MLPLYPQYSGATTGSTFDAIAAEMKSIRWVPELHFIDGYQQSPPYIDAIASSIRTHLDQHGLPDKLIFSYHGTPQKYLERGDPYHCLCHQTTRLVREQIDLSEERVMTTFQSRFGREPWLQPYTDKTVVKLAESGSKHVAIMAPGFVADCLETLDELDIELHEEFIEHGGETFTYIPCLNDSEDGMRVIEEVAIENLRGWVDLPTSVDKRPKKNIQQNNAR